MNSGEKKRVVMLLMNPCTHDTRVMKEATSLTNAGFEVHVVALMKPKLDAVSIVDGVTIHRVKPKLLQFWGVIATACFMFIPFARLPLVSASSSRSSQGSIWLVLGMPFVFVWILLLSIGYPLLKCAQYVVARLIRFNIKPYSFVRKNIKESKVTVAKTTLRILIKNHVRVTTAFYSRVVLLHTRLMIAVVKGNSKLFRQYSKNTYRFANALRTLATAKIAQFLPYSFRLHSINFDLAAKALLLEPDIIQSHDCNTLLGGAMIKRKLAIPFVYDSHELYLERNIGSRSRWWDKVQWSPIEKKCIVQCDVVMTVSQGIVDHLNTQYGRDDVVLVRNVQPYHEAPPRNPLLRDELGIPEDKKIALYIGAITFNRGIEELIQAATHLEHAVIVIMGPAINPHYVEELKSTASNLGVLNKEVFFRGPVESKEVLNYVASADIGVVPTQACCLSYEFESSNKIFHCVMAGVPLAMSNHIEKRILTEQYGIGVLFDETNPQDIAQVIDKYIQNTNQLEQDTDNCLNAAKELCWEKEERRLLTAMNTL